MECLQFQAFQGTLDSCQTDNGMFWGTGHLKTLWGGNWGLGGYRLLNGLYGGQEALLGKGVSRCCGVCRWGWGFGGFQMLVTEKLLYICSNHFGFQYLTQYSLIIMNLKIVHEQKKSIHFVTLMTGLLYYSRKATYKSETVFFKIEHKWRRILPEEIESILDYISCFA